LDVSPFEEKRAAEVAPEAVEVSTEERIAEVAPKATEAPTETEKIAEVATEAPEALTEAEKRVKLDVYHINAGFVGALGSIEAPEVGGVQAHGRECQLLSRAAARGRACEVRPCQVHFQWEWEALGGVGSRGALQCTGKRRQ
jgi:hypothetical protein